MSASALDTFVSRIRALLSSRDRCDSPDLLKRPFWESMQFLFVLTLRRNPSHAELTAIWQGGTAAFDELVARLLLQRT